MPESRTRRTDSRGQVIVIFAGAMMLFVLLCAVVIDLSWYWSSNLKMQRAGDAAALAGVVFLPGDVSGAYTAARNEATKNGYSAATGYTVTPLQDPTNPRRLRVSISGNINTFFARVAGINSFPATRKAQADYVLPVPMGSPDNYYGVFGLTRGLTSTDTTTTYHDEARVKDSGYQTATTAPATAGPAVGWTANTGSGTAEANLVAAVRNNDSAYVLTTTNGAYQVFGGFDLDPTGLATGETVTGIRGLQVYLDDAFLSGSCSSTKIQVQVSENGGTNWSGPITTNQTANLSTSTKDSNFGSSSNFTAWALTGGRTWNGTADFDPANFRVRLTALKGCATSNRELRLDQLRVIASYDTTVTVPVTTTTTTVLPDVNLRGPGTACPGGVGSCDLADGAVLNPRGFWGTLNTEGAANANGDAYQPYYDTPTSGVSPACSTVTTVRACYDPNAYYNYAVEMPQGSTGGSVWIYDPGFCDEDPGSGTGDRWFSGTNGVTTMYEVWDTNNTLYDTNDDGVGHAGTTPNATSGDLFRQMSASDPTMGGRAVSGGVQQCRTEVGTTYGDGRDYHNRWFLLYSGMTGGATGPTVYRIHTTSTDPADPTQQRNTDGENSFALYASATGGTPKVYGLGAMQAFTPLKATGGTTSSEFYLAQIEKVHAGKTVEISLWDPGDTNPLTASIEIEIPTSGGWTSTPVTYTGTLGTSNSGRADGSGGKPNCQMLTRTTPSTASISTFTSGGNTTGKFNGCWLTIDAVIPQDYQADQNGWWKIKYTMTGNGTSNDVTTWQVNIRGNPVHLVLP